MKKIIGMATTAFALTLATVPVGAVHAIDSPADSTAQFSATPGELTLDEIPDLRFANVTVANLISGPNDLVLESGTVDKLTDADQGTDQLQIVVTDNRGTNEGWKLSAKAGTFRFGDGDNPVETADLNVTGLTFDTVDVSSSGTTANAFITAASIIGGDTTVWTADNASTTTPNIGTGVNTAKVTAATLSLGQSPNAKAGTYRAPITWTLTAGPNN